MAAPRRNAIILSCLLIDYLWTEFVPILLLLLQGLAVAATDIIFAIEKEAHKGQVHLHEVRMVE